MAAAIQIGCRSRAMALTAVTTPPLPLRASKEPSAWREKVTGPRLEAMISGRVPRLASRAAVAGREPLCLVRGRAIGHALSFRARSRSADGPAAPAPSAVAHYASSCQMRSHACQRLHRCAARLKSRAGCSVIGTLRLGA